MCSHMRQRHLSTHIHGRPNVQFPGAYPGFFPYCRKSKFPALQRDTCAFTVYASCVLPAARFPPHCAAGGAVREPIRLPAVPPSMPSGRPVCGLIALCCRTPAGQYVSLYCSLWFLPGSPACEFIWLRIVPPACELMRPPTAHPSVRRADQHTAPSSAICATLTKSFPSGTSKKSKECMKPYVALRDRMLPCAPLY